MPSEVVEQLKYIFKPRSVAVVGASRDPKAWGHVILRNILKFGFKGPVYAVNPKAKEIYLPALNKTVQSYPSLKAVPGDVDLIVVAVPAKIVPRVMEEAVEKGVKGAVIISAGFRETQTEEGRKLEEEVVSIARKGGIRVVGPNCMGVFSAPANLNATFTAFVPMKGHIAFISQSGAFGTTMMGWATFKKIGFSGFVSVGNQADLEVTDFLEYFGEDDDTKVIIMYLEGVKDGRRFRRVAEEVTAKKPVIVMKVGYSKAGASTAASHTGSLAGQDQVYNAVFKQTGIIRVYEPDDMFNIAVAFTKLPIPKGPRVGAVSSGGGWAVETADILETLGLKLPPLPKHIIETMDKYVPPFWNRKNPMDLVATADPEPYYIAAEELAKDENFDIVLMIGYGIISKTAIPDLIPRDIEFAKKLGELIKKYRKPVIAITVFSPEESEVAKALEEAGVPTYITPEKAAKVIKAMVDYAMYLKRRGLLK